MRRTSRRSRQRTDHSRTRATPTRWSLLLVAGLLLGACGSDATLHGTVMDPLPNVQGLALPDALTGEPVPLRPEDGHVLLVYFGYTHCPDVCPTSLAHIKAALRRLGDRKAALVSLAFVTIDPTRDVGSVLQPYVRSFVPTATALRTTDDHDLRHVVDAFGADYSVTLLPDGDEEVSHTGTISAVDVTGHIVAQWTFNPEPDETSDLAHDLAILLRRASKAA